MNLHSLVETAFCKMGFSIQRIRKTTWSSKTNAASEAAPAQDLMQLLHNVAPNGTLFGYITLGMECDWLWTASQRSNASS